MTACSQKLAKRTERSKVGVGGVLRERCPFCRVKTAKPTKLSGREGGRIARFISGNQPGLVPPPAEKSLHGQGQEGFAQRPL